uniref:Phosphodiesterase n=1 Tax=Bursaphelenchus xylophilus TaxID=6326 RepID=A0A1I7RPK3_BURXY
MDNVIRKQSAPIHGCYCLGPCRQRTMQLDCCVGFLRKQSRVHASKPRVSNITFSTVTSATGLPTIAAEPSRPRSSNHWKPIHQDGPVEPPQPSSAAPPPTCQRQHHSSQSCSCLSQQSCQVHKPKEKSLYRRRYSSATEERSLKVIADGRDDAETAASEDAQAEKERRRSAGANVHQSPILINSSSTFSHSLSPSPFAKSPSVVAKSPSPSVAFSLHEEPEDGEPQSPPESEAKARTAASIDTWTTEDGIVYNKRELDRDKALQRIDEWSFPVFDLAEAYKTTVLSRITYAVFKQADLFNIFKISPQKFFNFFHALEMGYWEIPYHNRIHAADVLHGCHYLTCHPVNAFHPTPSTPDEEIAEGMEDLNIDSLFDSSSISIASTMNGLELMALYTAAAMHDFDHPGRTNAFLVAAEDKKAILYNDRSVLENHHAAESWKLLSKPENNFIDVLDAAETKRFRYLVLEYILATDLKQHFDIIMSFNDKAGDMDLSNEADRVLVSQMLIKFADINSPAKPYTLHRQWTDRICQEFYEQGDEEKVRNMPVSPYMDRNEPAVAKLQDSFIAHIVNPLVIALNEAGLLPSMPGLEDPEVIINLKHNHQKWLTEIEEHNPQEEEPKEEQGQDFGSASTTTATAFENDKMIYSMKEVEKKEDLVMNGACDKGDNEILGRFEVGGRCGGGDRAGSREDPERNTEVFLGHASPLAPAQGGRRHGGDAVGPDIDPPSPRPDTSAQDRAVICAFTAFEGVREEFL